MKSLTLIALSFAVRVVTGLSTTIILFKALPPAEFGFLIFFTTVSGLLTLVADAGSTSRILQSAGEQGLGASTQFQEAIKLKITLCCAILLPFTILTAACYHEPRLVLSATLICCAQICLSVGDISASVFRGLRLNKLEFYVAFASYGIYLVFVIVYFLVGGPILLLCVLMLAARLIYATFSLYFLSSATGTPFRAGLLSIRGAVAALRSSGWWLLSSTTSYFNGQIDGLLIAPLFGIYQNGAYQAVARFYSVAGQLPLIAVQFFTPRIANAKTDGIRLKLLTLFAGTGLIFGGLFVATAMFYSRDIITTYIIPPEYGNYYSLWSSLSILLFVRFMATFLVILLLSFGMPKLLAASEILIAITSTLSIILVRAFGSMDNVPIVMSGCIILGMICSAFMFWTRAKGPFFIPVARS